MNAQASRIPPTADLYSFVLEVSPSALDCKYVYFSTNSKSNKTYINTCKNIMWSRYRPGVAQRVGRGIALLFHDRGTRRGWVVNSTPRPHFTPGKDSVPIVQVAGWAPGPVWTGGKSRPHRDSIPDRPARSSVTIPTELPASQINRDWTAFPTKWDRIVFPRVSEVDRQDVKNTEGRDGRTNRCWRE